MENKIEFQKFVIEFIYCTYEIITFVAFETPKELSIMRILTTYIIKYEFLRIYS